MSSGALEGLLVVALEQAVAAPLCTARLAEGGARVIKVERPDGDFARGYDRVALGESAYFAWLNRQKQSIALDIKAPADADLLRSLLQVADVFVQNLASGAAARAGFASEALRARHPRLITCDVSGYGEAGPLSGMKAYDLLIQCESGLASITGSPGEPGRVGVSAADIACGLNAHAAILEALLRRERTGHGARLAVSLFDSVADWMTVPLLHNDYGGAGPTRVGLNHASIAPYGAYLSGEGRQIVIAVQNEREWVRFCETVLGRPALALDERFADNALRCQHRDALNAEIEAVFASLDDVALVQRLNASNTAYGRVNSVADLSVHPQLRRVAAGAPGGEIRLPASPVRWLETEDSEALARAPSLDQHGSLIRREFAAAYGSTSLQTTQ